jgi:hypothetical protein
MDFTRVADRLEERSGATPLSDLHFASKREPGVSSKVVTITRHSMVKGRALTRSHDGELLLDLSKPVGHEDLS